MNTQTTTLDRNSEQIVSVIADDLMENNQSRNQVINKLVNAGGSYTDAAIAVDAVISGLRSAFRRRIWTGLAWVAGGIGLTALTGGTFIFYGAVLYGLYEALRCTYHGYLKTY